MKTNKPVVYLPQEPMRKNADGQWVSKGLNLAPASEHGVISVVWPPDTSVISRELLERVAIDIAKAYNEERDHIIAIGSPSLIAMLAWAIGREGKMIQILEWDRAAQCYYPTLSEAATGESQNG